MGKKSSDPADVTGAAEIEGQYSRETARDQTYANRPDQYNAFGSNQWQTESVRDPATGEMTTKWTQRQNLTPQMQSLLDSQMGRNRSLSDSSSAAAARGAEDMSTPLEWGQFGDVAEGPSAYGPTGGDVATTTGDATFDWDSQNRQRAEDAAYGRATQRLDPQFEAERATLERQLTGRGLRAGDQAYDSAMTNFSTGKNDAYEMARMGATGEGRVEDLQAYNQAQGVWGTNRGTEQQRFEQGISTGANDRAANQQAFEQEMGSNERTNALRSQQIQEYLAKRGQSLEESKALQAATNIGETTSNFGGG